jgi:hypothetical protein
MLEYILQITFLLCLLVVFELSVDIPMDTNYAPFPADYSFISMKRTTVKRITPVVEAIAVSLKKCFFCAYRIDQKDNINECVVQIKAFGCCLFNLWEFHSGFSRKTANVTV